MEKGFIVVAAAVLVIIGAVGCSSPPAPFKAKPGALPAGTAQLIINGEDAGTSVAVVCTTVKDLTTIKIGDGPSAEAAMASNTDRLTVEGVRIHDLNGFTGSYDHGLGGDAQVTLAGATYHISGRAEGFHTGDPRLTTESFAIAVSC